MSPACVVPDQPQPVCGQLGPAAVTAWYLSRAWRPGEPLRVGTLVLEVGRSRGVLAAAVMPWGDPGTPAGRVGPISGQVVKPMAILQNETLLKLFDFP